jgi:hypothetical protein
MIDGHPYQQIDLWVDAPNQTAAGLRFEPLAYHGAAPPGSQLPPFDPFQCQ